KQENKGNDGKQENKGNVKKLNTETSGAAIEDSEEQEKWQCKKNGSKCDPVEHDEDDYDMMSFNMPMKETSIETFK
ncbi:hypothetical protein, partial [Salmonella sp. s51933]|uniref:hypothetical protein n=1 Tax=Salmonella sp. s51933 TaxID=3160127 RepID=UPI0037541961